MRYSRCVYLVAAVLCMVGVVNSDEPRILDNQNRDFEKENSPLAEPPESNDLSALKPIRGFSPSSLALHERPLQGHHRIEANGAALRLHQAAVPRLHAFRSLSAATQPKDRSAEGSEIEVPAANNIEPPAGALHPLSPEAKPAAATDALHEISTEEAQERDPQQALLDAVSARLLAVCEPVEGFAWPPVIEVSDKEEINAYATLRGVNEEGQPIPQVVIRRALLEEVVQGREDRLAYILGHELAHIELRHVAPRRGDPTPLAEMAFTRDQEFEADRKGMQLLLAAGYSRREAVLTMQRMIELGLAYSSFEALAASHPGWRDRLALLDEEQSQLWKSMSAFETGTFFLLLEQYESAARCYESVVAEFPECPEAWANLGYARLMQYCDMLDPEDLEYLGISGQIVVGGFYRRADSLEEDIRDLGDGSEEQLWRDAVAALSEAVRLDEHLVLANANLGIAYLVRPEGKDLEQATHWLSRAAEALGAPEFDQLDHTLAAAVLINLGVVDMTGGRAEQGSQRFEEASLAMRAFSSERAAEQPQAAVTAMRQALTYNKAVLLSASTDGEQQHEALALFEGYLQQASPSSVWWSLAYEKYADLCQATDAEPKTAENFAGTRGEHDDLRPITSVSLGEAGGIALSEGADTVQFRLGEAEIVPAIPNSNLQLLRYREHGIDLLIDERVIGIRLYGDEAPSLELMHTGLGSPTEVIELGMSKAALEEVLGDEPYDFRQFYESDKNYRYYRRLGLAVRVQSSQVVELVIAQIPERAIN